MDKPLSLDELLAIQHEEYIQQVNESGIPLWVAHMYNQCHPHPGVDDHNTSQDEVKHNLNPEQSAQEHGLPF